MENEKFVAPKKTMSLHFFFSLTYFLLTKKNSFLFAFPCLLKLNRILDLIRVLKLVHL